MQSTENEETKHDGRQKEKKERRKIKSKNKSLELPSPEQRGKFENTNNIERRPQREGIFSEGIRRKTGRNHLVIGFFLLNIENKPTTHAICRTSLHINLKICMHRDTNIDMTWHYVMYHSWYFTNWKILKTGWRTQKSNWSFHYSITAIWGNESSF